MSIPRQYSLALRTNLRARAAWPPTAALAPGDYGVFSGGVFSRLGNIRTDFGVPYVVESGGHQAEKFQFHSERSTHSGVDLDVGLAGADAALSIGLDARSSFFVSVAAFEVERLQSPRAVALALHEVSGWSHLRYFVVWELFRGEDLLFFGSESGASSIEVRGSTDDVKLLRRAGKVGASLEFQVRGDVGIQIRGGAGQPATFALNLFRAKLVGDPLALAFDGSAPPDDNVIDFVTPEDVPDEEYLDATS